MAAWSAVLAALLAGALPFFVSVTAWPEIVTPAWFVTRGLRLYDQILFPHTPLLILMTAAAGSLLGFSAPVLRAIPALALAASGVLVVLGARPQGPKRRGALAGLFLGIPLLALFTVYAEGPALWPEPFLAPFLLGGVFLLERAERTGAARAFAAAGLVFGTALLVKQTSAWAGLAAFLWLLFRGRRRDARAVLHFAAAAALPYVAFLLTWALAFRTLAHARWTLVYPVFSGMSREIAAPLTAADAHEALELFVPFAALALAAMALPAAASSGTPLVAVGLGAIGMAWPRPGLLHLSALTGLAALLAVSLGVAVLGAGPLLFDRLGQPLFYWDDAVTRAEAASVRTHVPPGGELLVFGGRQTLYPLTRTRAPGALYLNPFFWYCLNRDGGDERLVEAFRGRPGLAVLFRAPPADQKQVRATRVFSFLDTQTAPDGPGPGETTWRRVASRR